MIKYRKESHKGKTKIKNVMTEIITTFDDTGGEIKVSGGKVNLYPLTEHPFINSIKEVYADLQRVMNHEKNRREDSSGLAFAMVQKQYEGWYWAEFNNL